jgi:hypothetical protein
MRLALVLVAALVAPVFADTPVVLTVPAKPMHRPDEVLGSQVIYLNNCSASCVVKPGSTDASADTSELVQQQATFNEYAWMPGEWEQVVQCVKEVYSPFDVTVTDVRPTGSFNEAIVAGNPQDVGLPTGVGGVGQLTNDCSPLTNAVSFAFAESAVDIFAQEDGNNRVWGICWVISQEVAHLYGLDHEYVFTDTQSACNDPMTYRPDCGGEKFFRNKPAQCGEFGPPRVCKCGGLQNSHAKLLSLFGEGQSIVPAPTSTILAPPAGPVAAGFAVSATAGSARGVDHVELWLNGHNWLTGKGAAFGAQGQPNPSPYSLVAPHNVPDGIIDVVVKAYDDLGIETDSSTVTVTKGSACASAASCLTGQKCDAGKCYWDPPTGMLGDKCTYNEFCVTGMCQDSDIGQYCTQSCVVNSSDACPAMFDCIATSDTQGVCLPHDAGSSGCCSVGHESNRAVWAHIGLGLFVFGLVLRRRRRH